MQMIKFCFDFFECACMEAQLELHLTKMTNGSAAYCSDFFMVSLYASRRHALHFVVSASRTGVPGFADLGFLGLFWVD